MATFASRVERANYHHYVMDILWFGFALAATTRFLQFFAIRMGATPLELGWITSLPALILLFGTNLSFWWRNRHHTSKQAVWYPSIGFRFIFLLPAFAPFFPPEYRTLWLIVAAALPALPQAIASALFLVLMRETVSHNNMTALFTRRAFVMNVALTVGALSFGLLLEVVVFPLNYQLMFVFAFALSMISQWHLGRIENLQHTPTVPNKNRRSVMDLLKDTRFQSVAFITLISHIAYFSIFAVIPLRLEADLGASEGFFALYGTVELLAGAGVALVLTRFVELHGNRRLIVFAMLATVGAGITLAFAPSLWFTLIPAALTGAGWTALSIGVLGFFSERTDTDDVTASQIFHQMIFASMFIGPMLGSLMAQAGLSVVAVIWFGAGLRLIASAFSHYGLSLFGGERITPDR